MAYFTQQNSISSELNRIESLHQYSPELYVRDSREYACLEIDRTDNVHEYHCYLPEGKKYHLNLKWKEAFNMKRPAQPDLTYAMSPGTYRIYFEVKDRLRVRLDDQLVFDHPYQDPAKSSSYSVNGAGANFGSQWKSVGEPLILLSRSEYVPLRPADAPAEGISLWIEAD